MIELPEAITLGEQISSTLVGKPISKVYPASYPHKFTFFNGDPLAYSDLLEGKKIKSALGRGIFVDLFLKVGSCFKSTSTFNYHSAL